MISNEKYMQRCLQLAAYGAGNVAPNPMVGAVLVVEDEIIGEGYHERYGLAHAEPNAIYSVKNIDALKKATLYVNLEPCSHYGNTPPCAELIVSCGIPRVLIGTLDPNPKVSGRGVAIMQKAGIEVVVGVIEDECNELNKRFFTFQTQKRPFVLLKWAQTSDGYMDIKRFSRDEAPLQISNEITRQLTHKTRSENQAIMVSTNTVVLDNPSLTVRFWSGKNPIRIAIDRQGRIPENSQLLDGQHPTIVFTEKEKSNKNNLEFIQMKFDKNCLNTILSGLYDHQIHSVLVEGGSQFLQSMIAEGLWDEAHVEIANFDVNEGVKAPVLSIIPESTTIVSGHTLLKFKKK